jgi:hypothetical protein
MSEQQSDVTDGRNTRQQVEVRRVSAARALWVAPYFATDNGPRARVTVVPALLYSSLVYQRQNNVQFLFPGMLKVYHTDDNGCDSCFAYRKYRSNGCDSCFMYQKYQSSGCDSCFMYRKYRSSGFDLFRVPEVPVSNAGLETGYTGGRISGLFSVAPGKCRDINSNRETAASFHILSSSLFTN